MSDAGSGWTDERVDLLKRLWAEGLSASQVAAQLGNVTRNAVIGKVHRLGLAGRVKPGAQALDGPGSSIAAPRRAKPEREDRASAATGATTQARSAATAIRPVVAAAPAPVSAPPAIPLSERVTIMELRESMCRWPMGDPTTAEFRFCGARTFAGLPYCEHHAQIAYQPAAERRRDRRAVGFR